MPSLETSRPGRCPPPLLLLTKEGDWEAHADDETEEELEDATNVLPWTLGYLTDRFPETAEALRDGSRRRGLFGRRKRGLVAVAGRPLCPAS